MTTRGATCAASGASTLSTNISARRTRSGRSGRIWPSGWRGCNHCVYTRREESFSRARTSPRAGIAGQGARRRATEPWTSSWCARRRRAPGRGASPVRTASRRRAAAAAAAASRASSAFSSAAMRSASAMPSGEAAHRARAPRVFMPAAARLRFKFDSFFTGPVINPPDGRFDGLRLVRVGKLINGVSRDRVRTLRAQSTSARGDFALASVLRAASSTTHALSLQFIASF